VHEFELRTLLGEHLLNWFHHGQTSQGTGSDDLTDTSPTHPREHNMRDIITKLTMPLITGPHACHVMYADSMASPWPDKASGYLSRSQLGRVQDDLHCGTAGGRRGKLRQSRACEESDQTSRDRGALCKRYDPRACLHCVGIRSCGYGSGLGKLDLVTTATETSALMLCLGCVMLVIRENAVLPLAGALSLFP
jgi:hypothetical protein